MNRRDFLKSLAAAGVGVAFSAQAIEALAANPLENWGKIGSGPQYGTAIRLMDHIYGKNHPLESLGREHLSMFIPGVEKEAVAEGLRVVGWRYTRLFPSSDAEDLLNQLSILWLIVHTEAR